MNHSRVIEIVGITVGCASLFVQFYLMQVNRVTDSFETTLRFFSFFTILSNLAVVVCFTSLFFNILPFFKSFKIVTAIVVYISIVAIVYNTVLRFLWEPTGLQKIVDEFLHVINPLLFIYYWFKSDLNEKLNYTLLWKILIFPGLYLIFVLIRGYYSSYYPYPFINVSSIGYLQTLVNSIVVVLAFVIVSLAYIRISRR